MERIDLLRLSEMMQDRTSALEFLCSRFQRTVRCTSCRSSGYYVMARGNPGCSKCKTDYRPFGKSSAINQVGMDFVRWLALIKLFDLGVSAKKAGLESRVSHPVAPRAFDVMRAAITGHMARTDRKLRGVIEADEAYFGGRRKGNRDRMAKNRAIVFGIREGRQGGRVRVEIVDNASAKMLLSGTTRMVRKGSTLYADKWKGYDTLIMHGYKRKTSQPQQDVWQGPGAHQRH